MTVGAPVPADPAAAIAVELAHLRDAFGQVGRDLSEVKTSTAVLVERSTRADADLAQARTDAARETQETRGLIADHETRIRVMEKTLWRAIGAGAVLGAAAGAAAGWLGH